MKCSPIWVMVISVITINHPANANEVNVSAINNNYGRASVLTTQPIRIIREADNPTNQASRLRQVADSIPAEHNPGSRSVNPIDFFKDPTASLKRLGQENYNQASQKADPLKFFRVPALPSSFGVPVTRF